MTSSRTAAAIDAAPVRPVASATQPVAPADAACDPQRLLAAMADRVDLVDPDGNVAIRVAGGAGAGAAEGAWIERWAAEARPRVRAALGAARAGGGARFEAATADDDGAWWDVVVTPVAGARGEVERLLVVARDVGELRRARERAEALAAETARVNDELERVAHGAAHDLQEPLRMIANYVHLLESRYAPQLDERARQYMRFAIDGALRMQRLIRALLEYARLGQGDEGDADVALADAVADAVEELAGAIAASGARVEVDPLPVLRGSRTRFAQLFRHLLDNAITFRRHGAAPVIRVYAERGADGWTVSVRDDGIGVAAEHRERVFEIFKRLHSRDDYPGSGVGLALCRRIVGAGGGRIWVEDTPGGGATFRFTAPR